MNENKRPVLLLDPDVHEKLKELKKTEGINMKFYGNQAIRFQLDSLEHDQHKLEQYEAKLKEPQPVSIEQAA